MKGGTLPRQRDPQRGSRWRGRVLGDFLGWRDAIEATRGAGDVARRALGPGAAGGRRPGSGRMGARRRRTAREARRRRDQGGRQRRGARGGGWGKRAGTRGFHRGGSATRSIVHDTITQVQWAYGLAAVGGRRPGSRMCSVRKGRGERGEKWEGNRDGHVVRQAQGRFPGTRGCVPSVRPMCPVFGLMCPVPGRMCQLCGRMCPLWRGRCPVAADARPPVMVVRTRG